MFWDYCPASKSPTEGASVEQLPAPFTTLPRGLWDWDWKFTLQLAVSLPCPPGAEQQVKLLGVGGGSCCPILGYSAVSCKTY